MCTVGGLGREAAGDGMPDKCFGEENLGVARSSDVEILSGSGELSLVWDNADWMMCGARSDGAEGSAVRLLGWSGDGYVE
jgi:hypothetical protein